ncbi:MAG: iron-containing alcohol dehydrogenase [Chthoniobacterales bacterium]|nr:iron-containing alcohol dehydrogenase [Chthoniobacterales bacterium]
MLSAQVAQVDWNSFIGGGKVTRGVGCAKELCKEVLGSISGNLVLITGDKCMARKGPAATVAEELLDSGRLVLHLTLATEPEIVWLDEARIGLKPYHPAAVISIGGGSVLDAGKALAALLNERGPTQDFLEGVGSEKPSGKMLPWFAAPTTAGTGSEATTNAVISHHGEHAFKRSLRHNAYHPQGVWLDPQLLQGLPKEIAAASAFDAFTQLLEALTSVHLPPEIEDVIIYGAALAAYSLPKFVMECPTPSPQVGQAMLDAAFLSGVGLTRAGLGTIHGLAGKAGAVSRIPHAVFCANLFVPTWEATLEWFLANPDSPGVSAGIKRIAQVARFAGWVEQEKDDVSALLVFLETLRKWKEEFYFPPLREYGIGKFEVEEIVASGSDRNSPAKLGPTVWEQLLQKAGAVI